MLFPIDIAPIPGFGFPFVSFFSIRSNSSEVRVFYAPLLRLFVEVYVRLHEKVFFLYKSISVYWNRHFCFSLILLKLYLFYLYVCRFFSQQPIHYHFLSQILISDVGIPNLRNQLVVLVGSTFGHWSMSRSYPLPPTTQPSPLLFAFGAPQLLEKGPDEPFWFCRRLRLGWEFSTQASAPCGPIALAGFGGSKLKIKQSSRMVLVMAFRKLP